MRKLFSQLVLAGGVLLCGGASQNAIAETTWQAIKPSIFQDRVIHLARDIVELSAPYRAKDDRTIPISLKSKVAGTRSIKSVTFVADDNPMPVIGVFKLADGMSKFNVAMNIRLDGTSMVRAVVETNDGALYMTEKRVKTSGQGACASPPVSDLDLIDETIGQMTFTDVKTTATKNGFTSLSRRGRLKLSHPNLTGLQMNQITLQHIPARYINKLNVFQGDRELFSLESGITLSENPEIEFDYRLDGSTELTVKAIDTKGTEFKSSFPLPLSPSS